MPASEKIKLTGEEGVALLEAAGAWAINIENGMPEPTIGEGPLCRRFFDGGTCLACPIFKITGESLCCATPLVVLRRHLYPLMGHTHKYDPGNCPECYALSRAHMSYIYALHCFFCEEEE